MKRTKAFAQAVFANIANDAPDKYLIDMSRNGARGASSSTISAMTACRPPSRRCHRGHGRSAPISMPVNWNQVRDGLDPMRFTIKTVPALLARSNSSVRRLRCSASA